MLDISELWDIFKGRSKHELAQVTAFLLAPGLVLALTISGLDDRGLAVGMERPATIAQLKTELSGAGGITSRPGLVVLIEPVSSEYRIPLVQGTDRLWSSLSEEAMRANANR